MADYGSSQFWQERYVSDGDTFEWLGQYQHVRELIERHVPLEARILHVGAGTSRLSEELHAAGYNAGPIVNIDVARAAVDIMKRRYAHDQMLATHLVYKEMDVCSMGFEDGSFDAVIDKGTLDSVLCGENALRDSRRMLTEIKRVLSKTGVYISISYGVPEDRLPFLQKPYNAFQVSVDSVPKPSAMKSHGVIYVYICKKVAPVQADAA